MKQKARKKETAHRVRGRRTGKPRRSVLEGVREDIPSLPRAYRLARIASRAGFDWPNVEGALQKLDEEMGEFKEALALKNKKKIHEEIGDLFFVLVNVSRLLGIHPEAALKKTLKKFVSRFRYIEESLHRKGKSLSQSDPAEMERLWEEAKEKRIK